jgi:ABC-type lipoprotein release transport system permease subunit
MRTTRLKYKIILVLIFLVLFSDYIHLVNASSRTVNGIVIEDESEVVMSGARVIVLQRRAGRSWSNIWYSHSSTITDVQGCFTLNVDSEGNYLVIVSHLDESGEYDYIPYGFYINPGEDVINISVTLWRTSIVVFDGLDHFIESTAIPATTYRVTEPNSTDLINYGSLNLIYGSGRGSISSHLNIPSKKIYVPSNRNFRVEVQSYISYSGKTVQTILKINDFDAKTLEPGEFTQIDLRSLVLPEAITKLEEETKNLETLIIDKERDGFYLAVERQQLSEIHQTTNAAILVMEQGRFKEAFTKSREVFLLISDLENGLNGLLVDALRSVYILVGFTAITAIIFSSLLFEESKRKVFTSLILFAALAFALFYLHPGAQVTGVQDLVKVSVISIISLNIIALVSPFGLNKVASKVDVSLLNLTIPLISIAKRSLRRRKTRFVLTLTSVLFLVASFISLTSFTSGYGLSFNRISESVMKDGVMIRTPDPPPERAAAPFSGGPGVSGVTPLDESLLGWYLQIDEVAYIAPRYENFPQRQYREANNPIGRIGRTPIFGIVGIDPLFEAEVNKLSSTVIEGTYLTGETGEVLISKKFLEKTGYNIGDSFTLSSQEREHNLTIVGVLDDECLAELTDLDGYTILPKKIVEMERIEADGPDYVIEGLAPCTPDEVVWVSLATGENITSLWLQRIDLMLKDSVDALEFARSTALNRGFRAWASTQSGVYLAELTDYFNGKGLPIVIPWIIVVLNVIVTMMNAYYERRHEVMIYSSIGMNPWHISGIFLAEATVIGVLGGCIGYLFGLGTYKIIFLLTPSLQVKQKVSAVWSLAAIGISMMAVIVGGLSALKNSTSITPSLQRRWSIDKKQKSKDETRMSIPVQVYEDEVEEYVEFVGLKLEIGREANNLVVRMPKLVSSVEKGWEYRFIYGSANTQISALYSRNRLFIEKGEGKTYTIILYSVGDPESVKQAGSFVRQIGLDWSLKREEEWEKKNGNQFKER